MIGYEERTFTRGQMGEMVACYKSNMGNMAAALQTAFDSGLFPEVTTPDDVMFWLWKLDDIRRVTEKPNYRNPTPLELWIMEDLGIANTPKK